MNGLTMKPNRKPRKSKSVSAKYREVAILSTIPRIPTLPVRQRRRARNRVSQMRCLHEDLTDVYTEGMLFSIDVCAHISLHFQAQLTDYLH